MLFSYDHQGHHVSIEVTQTLSGRWTWYCSVDHQAPQRAWGSLFDSAELAELDAMDAAERMIQETPQLMQHLHALQQAATASTAHTPQ
ncbi:hypothetical protein ACG0Z6_03415 [Roseateles sp. BYS180W]|uniref:Uncharacterized protein n=1 Tax=Roseateles rivi TaxID=3299028 RepID=A0ABW7FSM7_9BURK